MRLADDRELRYAECGPSEGAPVLFFHGNGHCRLGRHPDDSIVDRLGIRLITADRPGLGGSTFDPRRTMLDWPHDVAELVDHLGLGSFSILAWSSGVPYALACAHELSDRVQCMALVSGIGSLDRPGARQMQSDARLMLQLASVSPRAVLGPLWLMRRQALRDADRLIAFLYARAPAPDRAILADPAIRRMFADAYCEAVRSGAHGLALEVALLARRWEFELSGIRTPTSLYHGDADTLTPPAMAQDLAERLPNAELTVYRGEGHQFLWPRWEQILQRLVS